MRLNDDVLENRLLSRWGELLPRAPKQVGAVHESDAELVPLGDGRLLAATIDTVAEEIRHGLYRDPATAGRMAVVSSLSDLAATGAQPIGVLLAVTLPDLDVQDAVARGAAEACAAHGTFVLGGDTSAGDALSVTCTALGVAPVEGRMMRIGAQTGDAIFASGPLGAGSVLAARAMLGADAAGAEQEFRPRARLREATSLRGIASACMDTSDGLIATLDQLARLNRACLRITRPLAALLQPAARELAERLRLPPFAFLAAAHGEYELVFTVPRDRVDEMQKAARSIGWSPLLVGVVQTGQGIVAEDRPIDGARVRNLAPDDTASYIRALCELA